MIALRRIAIALLSLFGLVAATAAVLWAAALAGLAQPVVVVTGAMEPTYQAGDLLISTRTPAAELVPGDVVTVPSAGSGPMVAERVLSVEPGDQRSWTITTGTAGSDRTTAHRMGAEAWSPSLRVPVVGGVVASIVEPQVALPLVAVAGLLVSVLLVGRPSSRPAALPLAARSGDVRS
jgi:signal peptidase I